MCIALLVALAACRNTPPIETPPAVNETEVYVQADILDEVPSDVIDEVPNEPTGVNDSTDNEPVVYVLEPVETILYTLLADEYIQGLAHDTTGSGGQVLAGTPYLAPPGSPTFTIVPHFYGVSNSIKVSDRQQDFYALDIPFETLGLSFGAVYTFRVAGRAAEGITIQLGRTDAPWSAYVQVTVPASGIWEVAYILTDSDLVEYFVSNQRGIRIMTTGAPTDEFIVDSIEVVRFGERGTDEPILPEWDTSIPSLADAFASHFLFGNIWSTASRMNSFNTSDGFLHHFNTVTAENNHKVDTIAANPNPDSWNFTTADYIVNWAEENDLAMVGHTLVWHSQSPSWLTTVPGTEVPLTRAEAIENMHLYIRTVAGRYAGRMYSWDVVNEAIWGVDSSRWNMNQDWRTFMRSAGRGLDVSRQSQWYDAFANGAAADECGSDYIFYAFRFARIYDPFAILYYNDYNDHVPGKRDAITQMVVQINERWQNDPLYDGRLLIEGIGMQAHYSISGWMSNPRYVRSAIELYITTGARIGITELDIVIGGSRENPATATPELLEAQAERYSLLLSWYLEFSDYIERVTLWGLADHFSWISWGHPLLFDENFRAKPAFFAVMEALENAPPSNISVPIILTDALPSSRINQSFAYQLTASQNNFAPIRWTVTDGRLPEGLRLVSATGVILGTPAESGNFTFTVSATNAKDSSTQTFTITIS